MGYYRTCPDCGAHLDPGERCDCVLHINEHKKSPLPTPTKAPGNEPRGNANSVVTQYHYTIPAGMTQEITIKRRCKAREN